MNHVEKLIQIIEGSPFDVKYVTNYSATQLLIEEEYTARGGYGTIWKDATEWSLSQMEDWVQFTKLHI